MEQRRFALGRVWRVFLGVSLACFVKAGFVEDPMISEVYGAMGLLFALIWVCGFVPLEDD